MIRHAETKDIPHVLTALGKLFDYLKSKGYDRYAEDQNQYVGGMIEYIALKMNNQNHAVMIDGESVLIGMVEPFPGFMKHKLVGVLEYVYPLSFGSTLLAQKFFEWAQSKGATAIMCLTPAVQEKLIPMYERQGFSTEQIIMIREL